MGGVAAVLTRLGLGVVDPLLTMTAAGAGLLLPYLRVQSEGARRARQVERSLPFAIDLASLAMSAGLDFQSALRQVTEKAPDRAGHWETLGVAQYRAGDWKAAAAALDKCRALRKGQETYVGFFEAMVYWQLGERDRAKEVYGRVREWTAKYKSKDADWQRFQAEAAALLGVNRDWVRYRIERHGLVPGNSPGERE